MFPTTRNTIKTLNSKCLSTTIKQSTLIDENKIDKIDEFTKIMEELNNRSLEIKKLQDLITDSIDNKYSLDKDKDEEDKEYLTIANVKVLNNIDKNIDKNKKNKFVKINKKNK